jgi:hypothetical protein
MIDRRRRETYAGVQASREPGGVAECFMTLDELQRIKQWAVSHREQQPVEYHTWDAMLTVWLVGWVGWIPAFTFGAIWAAPLLAAAMSAPTIYVAWRRQAHEARRLRCDWLR